MSVVRNSDGDYQMLGVPVLSVFDQEIHLNAINILKSELEGLYGAATIADMNKIIQYYGVYEYGASLPSDNVGDYVPSDVRFKQIKKIIDKIARFMFCKPVTFNVETTEDGETNEVTQAYLNEVLKKSQLNRKLIQAEKDCLIGERIAIFLNFDDDGVTISFAPSLEFIYDVDENNSDRLIKIIRVYNINDPMDKKEQRIYKKKYWIADDGFCWVEEGIYSGTGNCIEWITEPKKLLFTEIPAFVILNDGLLGDTFGESEVATLWQDEAYYNKLSNSDIDSLRKGMNQIVYTVNMNPTSTKDLSRSPGAYWDLDSITNSQGDHVASQIGTLSNSMEYSTALDVTLKRIKGDMFEQSAVPDTTSDSLKGLVTSGKTLEAIYWDLMTRCDEKFIIWQTALEQLGMFIIEGSMLYPNVRDVYKTVGELSNEITLKVENDYPLLKDTNAEMTMDLAKVRDKVMSRKTFMKKWENKNDKSSRSELAQIIFETRMLDETYLPDDYTDEDLQAIEEIENELNDIEA